jgi:hypothetical protein
LNEGVWNGKRLLPEAWVDAATSKQVSNAPNPNPDWEQGYGYQFWRCRHNFYRGDGAFGQYCIVMPEQDAVLAITSGVADMQAVLNIVWDKLLPAIGKEPLPEDEVSAKKLSNKLKGLKLTPPQGQAASPLAASLTGKTFTFETNDDTMKSLRFDFAAGQMSYQLLGGGRGSGRSSNRRGKYTLAFGNGVWVESSAVLGDPAYQAVAASGVWKSKDTFELTACQYQTPFIATITCRFEGDQVFYDYKANVSFGPSDHPTFIGKLTE